MGAEDGGAEDGGREGMREPVKNGGLRQLNWVSSSAAPQEASMSDDRGLPESARRGFLLIGVAPI